MTAKHLAVAMVALALVTSGVSALMPWPREGIAGVENGKAAPFVGTWSMQQAGRPDTIYATCDLPVRIRAATDDHIFYEGPNDPEAEAATELVAGNGRTRWVPIAGGPEYFVVWVHPDRFHLYEADVEDDVDWGEPFAFTRCD